MAMPGRKYEPASGYRYGFNGQEKSPEIIESSTTALFWEYDARIARRWNVDPIIRFSESSYSVLGNNPIILMDPNGADTVKFISRMEVTNFRGKSDGHSDNLVTKSSVKLKSQFRIEIVPKEGDNVYVYYKISVVDGVAQIVPTVLDPVDGCHGITKGKNIYFDGLITTQRDNKDHESISKFMYMDKGFSDYMIKKNPNWKGLASQDMSIAYMEGFLPILVRGLMGSWLAFRYLTPLSIGGNVMSKTVTAESSVESYANLMRPLDELDVTTTLFRGTTGSEVGATRIFLTNDATVAATYVRNGGQVMQYEMSQFSLKSLQASGELTLKTGINGATGTVSTEYLFSGKNLVQALNNVAKPIPK